MARPCVLGCTIKATCFCTATNPSPLSPCLGLSASVTRPAGGCGCLSGVCRVSGLERNLGHGESKSEELLFVQEGGLTLSRRALAPRPSHPCAGSLQEMLGSPSRSGGILTADQIHIFLTSDLRSAVLYTISDEKSFPRKGREGELAAALNLQPSREGLLQTMSRFKGRPRFTSGFMNNRTRSARFVLPRNPAVPE